MATASDNVMQYVVAVLVVAIISKVVTKYKQLQGDQTQRNLIRGFLTFFSVSLCWFPISLMLGGIAYRNKFFKREAPDNTPIIVRG